MSTISQATIKNKASNPAPRSSVGKKVFNSSTSSIKGIKTVKEAKVKSKKESDAFSAKIRAIGNSKGVIINTKLMEAAGIHQDTNLIMFADEGKIILMEAPKQGVNTNLATWDKHFKAAIKKGASPEPDLFNSLENNFDKNEW